MNNEETILTAKKLAKKVLDLNMVCDKSKLQKIELERLNDLVEHARTMFADASSYNPADDDKSFT